MGILHGENTRLAGRSQIGVEARLQEPRTDLVDLRNASNVCDSHLIWCNTNNVTILAMEVVHVEDAAA